MKFEKDVFISYAHLDDKPLDEGAIGWITNFHKVLELRLGQTIGYKIGIWRDEQLTGNDFFAREIESKLPVLKVLVSIITPNYLGSEWCKRELGSFCKVAAVNGGISIGNKSRIFKIVKTPVDKDVIEKLPEGIHRIFDEILDYKFYVPDPITGKVTELSLNKWADDKMQQQYMAKLEDVVWDMKELIKQLNSIENNLAEGKNNPVEEEKNLVEKKKIYLAETSFDMQVYRDNLVRELKEADFTVLPDKNLHLVVDKFTEQVENYLDQCMLAIHIISPTKYSVQPEGADKSTVILQNEIAAEKSASKNLNRLIWIPPSTQAIETNEHLAEKQKDFLHDLKTNIEYQRGADIVEGPLEEFKQAIFENIRRIDAEETAKKVNDALKNTISVDRGPKSVYLICDQRDFDNTRPLEDLLIDNGAEVLFPLFEGDQAQLRQAHLENLKLCDAVIIYYGSGNRLWAKSMTSDLMRLPGMGRLKPLIEKVIYLGGVPDRDKETLKANDMEIINGLNGFTADLFNDFLKKLKQ